MNNPKVGAILHVGQPSVNTLGVGDLIFGKAVPAGRTIQTIYPEEYQNSISIFDFNMRPGPSPFARPDCTTNPCPNGTNPGRTHRFYTGTPVVPFGFGLSCKLLQCAYLYMSSPLSNCNKCRHHFHVFSGGVGHQHFHQGGRRHARRDREGW